MKLPPSIVLGTVQFGIPYGRRSGHEPLSAACVAGILEEAWSLGIRSFDTARDYGCAASRLAGWLGEHGHAAECDVTTKVPSHQVSRDAVLQAAEPFADVARLTVLTHGPVTADTFAALLAVGDEFGISAGQSVYDSVDVNAAARAGAQRVQSRLSVLNTEQLCSAQRNGVPFDGRSVYLQGVLLDSPDDAARRVPGIENMVRIVQSAARACGLPLAPALLAGALSQLTDRDRVVLGVDSPDQLEAVRVASKLSPGDVAEFLVQLEGARSLAHSQPHLLDPRKWPTAK
jgi:aryl-alcohol dehydrogenase-like predicted oxidoreductase